MPLKCRGCGCTDDRACPGGCSWISIDPPICSACEPPIAAEDADQDCCPADPLGFHQPLWLTERTGYCAGCRVSFVARDVA